MDNKNKRIAKRLTLTFLIFCSAFTLLVAHLAWIQLVQGEELQKKALQRRMKNTLLIPPRGIIMDRNGNELVINTKVDSIYAIPGVIDNPQQAARELSTVLEIDQNELVKKLTSDLPFVWIKRMVDFEVSQKVKNLNIAGIEFIKENGRLYLREAMAAHLLGFTGVDNQALMGIEKSYDEELRGKPGQILAEYGAKGRKIPGSTYQYDKPVPGNNLVLTLDENIQYFVERELDNIVKNYEPKLAVALVMDPKTGEILAMGNRPSFDCNHWTEFPKDVWDRNPAIWYTYEPGSTFKTITAAAALEEGAVDLKDRFYDPGYIKIAGRIIHCWKPEGHGSQTFEEVMENSCNPGIIEVGLKLGKERFYKYIEGFGFGRKTGINLPGEEEGILIAEEKATDLNIASMSMGQSIAVTPIQLISAISAVANGGSLMKPHLVKKIITPEGKTIKEIKPEEIRRVISKDTAKQVCRILEKVVSEGTGNKAYIEGYRVAGKTGTAEVVGDGGYVHQKYVASFAGFAPADNPRISILVMVAEPKGDVYHGGLVAAPSFKAIAEDTLRYLKVRRVFKTGEPQQSRETEKSNSKIQVPGVINLPAEAAKKILASRGLNVNISGEGDFICNQNPEPGMMVTKGCRVYLSLGNQSDENNSNKVVVPDLQGLTIKQAASIAQDLDLFLIPQGTGLAVKQNVKPGSKVIKGTHIKVTFKPPGSN